MRLRCFSDVISSVYVYGVRSVAALVSCYCFIIVEAVHCFRGRGIYLVFVLLCSQRLGSHSCETLWELLHRDPCGKLVGMLGCFDGSSWRGTRSKTARGKCFFIALALSRVVLSFKGQTSKHITVNYLYGLFIQEIRKKSEENPYLSVITSNKNKRGPKLKSQGGPR